MLKRFFLSIIILSALASEGGVYLSSELIEYYLINLPHFDMVQESRTTLQNSLTRKGTPVSFFKNISQDAINAKSQSKHKQLDGYYIFGLPVFIIFAIVSYFKLKNQIIQVARRILLSLTDSSPPVCC